MKDNSKIDVKRILKNNKSASYFAMKDVSEEEALLRLRKLKLYKIGAMLFIVICVMVFLTLGWFSSNNLISATNGSVKVGTDVFSISPLSDNTVSQNVFSDKLDEAEELTNKTGAMTWAMTPDYHMINVLGANDAGGYDTTDLKELGIRPGAYGEIRFVITPSKPKVDAEFTFEIYAFAYQENSGEAEDNDELQLLNSTDNSKILDLLNGHILLFGKRSGTSGAYQYTDFLISEDMTTRLKEAQYSGQETVKIYWVWPDTLAEILLPSGSRYLNGKVPLCGNSATNSAVKAYFKAHPEYLFYDEINQNNYSEIKAASDISVYLTDGHYEEYSSLYNNADQYIGTNVGYVLLYMNATGSEHID